MTDQVGQPSPKLPLHERALSTQKPIERPGATRERKISWDLKEEDGAQTTSIEDGRGKGERVAARGQEEKSDGNHSEDQPIKSNDVSDPHHSNHNQSRRPHSNQHQRQVSWGGYSIEIPAAYESTMDTDSVLSPHDTHFDDVNVLENEERSRMAAEAVQAAEAALLSKSPPSTFHNRFHSSISSGFKDDLVKTHPIESEAEAHILKAIESAEAQRQQQQEMIRDANGTSDPSEADEAVAKLFTPLTDNLLGNVPEGSEGIFQRTTSEGVASSAAGGSSISSPVTNSSRRSSLRSHRREQSQDSVSGINSASGGGGGSSNHNTGTTPLSSSPSRRGLLSRITSNNTTSTETTAYHAQTSLHARHKTMEETLSDLNQAFDSVDRQAAEMISVVPPPSLDNLPPPRTTACETSATVDSGRGRTTSLDLFNENMARLFQDVGVNDTRIIPALEEDETKPLTMDISEADAANDNDAIGYPSLAYSGEPKEAAPERADQSESQLFGEQIPCGAENYVYSIDQSVDHREGADLEPGLAHSETFESLRDKAALDDSNRTSGSGLRNGRKKKRSLLFRFFKKAGIVQNIDDFLKPRRPSIWRFIHALVWLIFVAIGAAVVLFYFVGNPPTGIVDLEASSALNETFVTTEGKKIDPYERASHSWWILYACVRLPITFAIAKFLAAVIIDFLILDRRFIVSCMGPSFTLLLVQSKGWPAIMFFFSLCNLGLLYGDSEFVAHWGYWQDYLDVFNASNPSGSYIPSQFNLRLQLCALGVSVVVSIKRLLIGFYQGRKIFVTYAEDLTNVMSKILLISEVANLAARLENEMLDGVEDIEAVSHSLNKRASYAAIDDAARKLNQDIEEEEEKDRDGDNSSAHSASHSASHRSHPSHPSGDRRIKKLVISEDKEYATGRLTQAQKRRIERLLGNWEEPEQQPVVPDDVSIGAILQFRTSLGKLDTQFPFAFAFGKADTRDHCIESSQQLYLRLLDATPDSTLHFNIIGLIALQRDGTLDQEKLKSLIKVLRPGRSGHLTLVDFVKSVVRLPVLMLNFEFEPPFTRSNSC